MADRFSSRRLALNAFLTFMATFMAGHFIGKDFASAVCWSVAAVTGATVTVVQHLVTYGTRPRPALSGLWQRWQFALLNVPLFFYLVAQSLPGLFVRHGQFRSADSFKFLILACAVISRGLSIASTARPRVGHR